MIKKLNDLVARNLKWKLISFVSAFILWIFVMWQTDPQINHSLNIPLTINNINYLTRNDLVILNESEILGTHVIVNLRAKKSSINNLNRNRNNFSVFIDAEDIDIESFRELGEPIKMDVKHSFLNNTVRDNITVVSIIPYSLNVILDDVITREFKITLDRTGYVHENFISLLPVISPETVVLKGNRTMIESVRAVYATIDLQGQSSNTNIVSTLKVMDYEENDITAQFEFSNEEVEVFVPIYERKEIPIEQPNIIGNVAEGYVISSIILTPSYIEVIGDSLNIVRLDKVVLEPIDVSGLDSSLTRTYDLSSYVSDFDLNIRNGIPHEVKVAVNIELQVTREVLIPTENILNVGRDIQYGINDEYVVAMISGSEKDLDDLDVNELILTINLTDYEEGEYLVDVNILLPNSSLSVIESKAIDISIFEDSDIDNIEEQDTDISMNQNDNSQVDN